MISREIAHDARSADLDAPAEQRDEQVHVSVLERREQIANLIEIVPRVSVAELAEQFGVTDVSIRRDLTILEEEGLLRRVHGGAVAATREHGRNAYAQRARVAREEKKRIGAAAAALINAGDVVVLDSGSTVAQVAAHVSRPLRRSNALTVVTNSLPVLDEVGRWESPHLVCLGGLYLPDHQALVGPQTVADMRDLSADIVFIGCDGLTLEAGLTTPHSLVAEVGAVIASRGRRVVVVADSTKVGRHGFTPIVSLTDVHVLVTDR
ncbi:MAG: DeoR/GlpR family DNA-binding transcription regulator, partial [Actinomycetota bacterium]